MALSHNGLCWISGGTLVLAEFGSIFFLLGRLVTLYSGFVEEISKGLCGGAKKPSMHVPWRKMHAST